MPGEVRPENRRLRYLEPPITDEKRKQLKEKHRKDVAECLKRAERTGYRKRNISTREEKEIEIDTSDLMDPKSMATMRQHSSDIVQKRFRTNNRALLQKQMHANFHRNIKIDKPQTPTKEELLEEVVRSISRASSRQGSVASKGRPDNGSAIGNYLKKWNMRSLLKEKSSKRLRRFK